MAMRKKENTVEVTPLLQETISVLKDIQEKERGIKSEHYSGAYHAKKSKIKEALDEVRTLNEQIELENQLKQMEINERLDLEIAYFADFLSTGEKEKIKETYQSELEVAKNRLKIAKARYEEVKSNVSEAVVPLKEQLTIYKHLAYAREIEYRLDKKKNAERKRYFDLDANQPYNRAVDLISKHIADIEKFLKHREEFEAKCAEAANPIKGAIV